MSQNILKISEYQFDIDSRCPLFSNRDIMVDCIISDEATIEFCKAWMRCILIRGYNISGVNTEEEKQELQELESKYNFNRYPWYTGKASYMIDAAVDDEWIAYGTMIYAVEPLSINPNKYTVAFHIDVLDKAPTSDVYTDLTRKSERKSRRLFDTEHEWLEEGDVLFIDDYYFDLEKHAPWQPYDSTYNTNTVYSIISDEETINFCKAWVECMTIRAYNVFAPVSPEERRTLRSHLKKYRFDKKPWRHGVSFYKIDGEINADQIAEGVMITKLDKIDESLYRVYFEIDKVRDMTDEEYDQSFQNLFKEMEDIVRRHKK